MPDADEPINLAEEEARLTAELADWLPKPGDQLFVASKDGRFLDPVGISRAGGPWGGWYAYASGFLHAADRLVDGWDGAAFEDELIYPILNLYRHHLELQLKCVLRLCPGCSDELRKWIASKHGLVALWGKIAEVYSQFGEWSDADTTAACEELIQEFDKHDPTSQATRYPVDQKGKQALPDLGQIDPRVLKRGVHKTSHYLGILMEQIGQEQKWEADMASW